MNKEIGFLTGNPENDVIMKGIRFKVAFCRELMPFHIILTYFGKSRSDWNDMEIQIWNGSSSFAEKENEDLASKVNSTFGYLLVLPKYSEEVFEDSPCRRMNALMNLVDIHLCEVSKKEEAIDAKLLVLDCEFDYEICQS